MDYRILTGSEITEERYAEFEALEHYTWPRGSDGYLPPEYVRSLYPDSFEGIFLAIDPDTDRLAGYFNAILTDQENMKRYFAGSFTDLHSVPKEKGKDMVLYLYTANLYPQYRGTSCMRELGMAFAAWLDSLAEQGYRFPDVYCETVSADGVRTAVSGFGMSPMADVDENGLGHYHNGNGLAEYREAMRALREE